MKMNNKKKKMKAVELISYFNLFSTNSSNQSFPPQIQPNGSPCILISCLFVFNVFFIHGLCFMVETIRTRGSVSVDENGTNHSVRKKVFF